MIFCFAAVLSNIFEPERDSVRKDIKLAFLLYFSLFTVLLYLEIGLYIH